MYGPLLALEDINVRCRSTLTKLLLTRHQVRVTPSSSDYGKADSQGLAWFVAFDPWATCWRAPQGSISYFGVAERKGVITPSEAAGLSRALLLQAVTTARSYDGVFRSFFLEPRVQFLLAHADNPEHLSDTGIGIGPSPVDFLLERCPWPLVPDKHLQVQGFQEIRAQDDLEFYAQSPWLAWAEALDAVGFSIWLGYRPWEILALFQNLNRLVEDEPAPRLSKERTIGQHIRIPLYSNGLQGAVLGVFNEIADEKRDPIHSSLLQFGQTMADVYAEKRMLRFASMLSRQLPIHQIAQEAVKALSPIGRLIVETRQEMCGYKLRYEENYWGGYELLDGPELRERPSAHCFTLEAPGKNLIHIEPLSDITTFDPDFARLRIESGFRRTFIPIDSPLFDDVLSAAEVQRRIRELETYMAGEKPSAAKVRQYFIARQIERDLRLGATKVHNFQLRNFLEERTGGTVKSGYQVSSFVGEVERLFPKKLKIEKTRNGVSLSWKIGR